MLNLAKKRYQNSKIDFVSKRDQIDLVATMLKNNLKGYSQMRKYKTEINPKLDNLHTFEDVIKYVSGLDYVNRLYFFSAGLLELTMFELHYIERNTEIKEATRNAEVLKAIFNKNSKNVKLNANNYVDICDIKNVVLNVFCDLHTSSNVIKNPRIKEIICAYESNFNKYFKGVLSPIDIFTSLIYLKSESVSSVQFNNGIDRLNASIKNSGGGVSKIKIDKETADDLIEKLTEVVPMAEVKQHVEVLKENNELIDLTISEVNAEYTSKDKLEILDMFVLLGCPVTDITEV